MPHLATHSRILSTTAHLYADSLKPENFPALPSRLGGGRLTAGGGLCALTLEAAAMHSRAAQMQADVIRAIAALCKCCVSNQDKAAASVGRMHTHLAYAPKQGSRAPQTHVGHDGSWTLHQPSPELTQETASGLPSLLWACISRASSRAGSSTTAVERRPAQCCALAVAELPAGADAMTGHNRQYRSAQHLMRTHVN
jgi:hypothetical protein